MITKKEWVVAIIVIIILFFCLNSIKKSSAPFEKNQKQEETAIAPKTPEGRIENKVVDVLGKKTNMGEKRVIKVSIKDDEASILFHADENFTTNMTRGGILTDIKDLFQEVPSVLEPQINSIAIASFFTLVDIYGNETSEPVVMITMKKVGWEKINWKNFNRDNFPNVAKTYWVHPALK